MLTALTYLEIYNRGKDAPQDLTSAFISYLEEGGADLTQEQFRHIVENPLNLDKSAIPLILDRFSERESSLPDAIIKLKDSDVRFTVRDLRLLMNRYSIYQIEGTSDKFSLKTLFNKGFIDRKLLNPLKIAGFSENLDIRIFTLIPETALLGVDRLGKQRITELLRIAKELSYENPILQYEYDLITHAAEHLIFTGLVKMLPRITQGASGQKIKEGMLLNVKIALAIFEITGIRNLVDMARLNDQEINHLVSDYRNDKRAIHREIVFSFLVQRKAAKAIRALYPEP